MVKVNGPSADRAAHRPMVSIRRTQVKEHRSDGRQFCCTRTAGAICVRIVRNGPSIGFQGLGADGCRGIGPVMSAALTTVRHLSADKPLDRNGVISGSDNADGADGRAPTFSGAEADGSGRGSALAATVSCKHRLPAFSCGGHRVYARPIGSLYVHVSFQGRPKNCAAFQVLHSARGSLEPTTD
jgi:hypothetical protein